MPPFARTLPLATARCIAAYGAPPAEAPVETSAVEPKGELTPHAEEPRVPEAYSYDARDRRNPWESYLARAEAQPEGTGVLERFSLEELRLVGVVVGATPLALLETPDGEGHGVRIGARVGTFRGQVRDIRPSGLVVEEHLRDGIGRVFRRERVIPLRRET